MTRTNKQPDRSEAPAPSPLASWLVNIGLLAIAIATLLPILRLWTAEFRYFYTAGAALVLIGRCMSAGIYRDESLRVRRLGRMELWAGVIFAVGAFFTFWKGAGPTDWLAFTLAGAALQGYASLMLPRALRNRDGD